MALPAFLFLSDFILGKLAMVASTVSSKMVEAMAKAEGFHFAECLTG
jgi:phosphomannomutase